MIKKLLSTLFLICLSSIMLLAKNSATTAQAHLDSSSFLMGTRIMLRVTAQISTKLTAQLPSSLNLPNIDLLEVTPQTDSVIDKNTQLVQRQYALMAFDSGNHVITAIKIDILKKGIVVDSITTEPLSFNIYTIKNLDLTKPIKDIRAPYKVQLTFAEFWFTYKYYLLTAILLAAVLVGARWWFKKYYVPRSVTGNSGLLPTPENAFDIAIRALEQLKEQRLWQQGQTKLYFSTLSEILRNYLEARFNVSALEMPTKEILDKFQFRHDWVDERQYEQLKNLLQLSDLVKFARHETLPDENQNAYFDAYAFVNSTKFVATSIANSEPTI